MYQVFSRVDDSGAVVESNEGFLKGEFASLEDAVDFSSHIPGGCVRDQDGRVLLPDGGWA